MICEKTLILNPFWESKNIDFHIFFDIFWKYFSSSVLNAKKTTKIVHKDEGVHFLGSDLRNARLLGREKERGYKRLEQEILNKNLLKKNYQNLTLCV